MAEAQKVSYTREGLKELQDELAERQTVKAKEISARLEEARAQGDLSENSEYDDAKDAQSRNASRIQELIALLENAVVIEESEISKTKVTLGSKVTIRDNETGEEETYKLVSENEEDIFKNKLSHKSPLGAAIIDKKKGQVVEVQTPFGAFKYKIVKIGE